MLLFFLFSINSYAGSCFLPGMSVCPLSKLFRGDSGGFKKDLAKFSEAFGKKGFAVRNGAPGGNVLSFLAFVNQLNQAKNATGCDFDTMKPVVQSSLTQCVSAHSRAVQLCEPSNNVPLNQAIANTQKATQSVQAAAKTAGLKQACEQFTNSVNELQNALNSYINGCDPVQAKCQMDCSGAQIQSASAHHAVGADTQCESKKSSISQQLNQVSSGSSAKQVSCAGYASKILAADRDARELASNEAIAQLCQQQITKDCTQGECGNNAESLAKMEKTTDQQQFGQARDHESEFRESKYLHLAEHRGQNLAAEGGAQANATSGQFSLASSGGGRRQAASMDRGVHTVNGFGAEDEWDQLSEEDRERGVQSTGASSDNESADGLFESTSSNAADSFQFASDGSESGREKEINPELEKYLPGGSVEQAQALPDGITTKNGKSLFDKISDRYSSYRSDLTHFSQVINSLPTKEVEKRVRRKMTFQDVRSSSD